MALAMASIMGFWSCGSKEKQQESGKQETVTRDMMFESYTYDLLGEFVDSDSLLNRGEAYIRFSSQGVLPRDLGDGSVKLLRDSLMKLAGIVEGDDGKPVPMMPDSMSVAPNEADTIEDTGYEYSTLTATLVTPRVVVWEAYRESYPWHAAHGNLSKTFVNYSLGDGNMLTLSDLMKPGYEATLKKNIQEKIKGKEISLLCPLNEVGISDEFAITSTGLLFSYDPYLITPYSEGIITIEIPVEELTELLNERGIYLITGATPLQNQNQN